MSLASTASSFISLLRHRVVCAKVLEVFIYRYHLPSVCSSQNRICVFDQEIAFVPFFALSIAISRFTLLLPSDFRPFRLAGGCGGRRLYFPLFLLGGGGLDSSYRFWFRLFGFKLPHRCFFLPLFATQLSSFYPGPFISPSLLIQPNKLCFSTPELEFIVFKPDPARPGVQSRRSSLHKKLNALFI